MNNNSDAMGLGEYFSKDEWKMYFTTVCFGGISLKFLRLKKRKRIAQYYQSCLQNYGMIVCFCSKLKMELFGGVRNTWF